jgi:ribonuclease P protein component
MPPGSAPLRSAAWRLVALRGAARFDAVFERGQRFRSPHFVLHMLQQPPAAEAGAVTTVALGFVVSKRHARRATRRNLIRRHWRAALQAWLAALPPSGVGELSLIVRLAAPWTPAEGFRSQRSERLAAALRREIEPLLERARRRLAPPSASMGEARP